MSQSVDPTVIEALYRQDFGSFVHKCFLSLSPGQRFIPGFYIDAIVCQLERLRRGEITRLIINMPPRSLKSMIASVAFPAFVLGHDPTQRIICVSYSSDLARRFSNDFRALIDNLGIVRCSRERVSAPTRTARPKSN